MRFCDEHWKALRDEIAGAGLSALVADTGEQAAAKLADSVQYGSDVDNFDPLMRAYLSISVHAFEILTKHGQPIPTTEDACLLCVLQYFHTATCHQAECDWNYANDWIPGAVADEVEAWKAMHR